MHPRSTNQLFQNVRPDQRTIFNQPTLGLGMSSYLGKYGGIILDAPQITPSCLCKIVKENVSRQPNHITRPTQHVNGELTEIASSTMTYMQIRQHRSPKRIIRPNLRKHRIQPRSRNSFKISSGTSVTLFFLYFRSQNLLVQNEDRRSNTLRFKEKKQSAMAGECTRLVPAH